MNRDRVIKLKNW